MQLFGNNELSRGSYFWVRFCILEFFVGFVKENINLMIEKGSLDPDYLSIKTYANRLQNNEPIQGTLF